MVTRRAADRPTCSDELCSDELCGDELRGDELRGDELRGDELRGDEVSDSDLPVPERGTKSSYQVADSAAKRHGRRVRFQVSKSDSEFNLSVEFGH